MKICTKCNIEKHFYDFSKDKTKKNGLCSNCKNCRKQWAKNNREKLNYNQKKWRENNREYYKEYKKKRCSEDILFKFNKSIKNTIYQSFKRTNGKYNKENKTFYLLGCTIYFFKEYIEKKFTDEMSWENYGKWHLDHIYPTSLAKNKQELIKLNHYTNFQPLWAIDNIKKSNKIIWQEVENQKD